MTPGAYVRLCRERAGWSIDDLALRIETVPPVSAAARVELLRAIEAGWVPVSVSVARTFELLDDLAFDLDQLSQLAAQPFRMLPAPTLDQRP